MPSDVPMMRGPGLTCAPVRGRVLPCTWGPPGRDLGGGEVACVGQQREGSGGAGSVLSRCRAGGSEQGPWVGAGGFCSDRVRVWPWVRLGSGWGSLGGGCYWGVTRGQVGNHGHQGHPGSPGGMAPPEAGGPASCRGPGPAVSLA